MYIIDIFSILDTLMSMSYDPSPWLVGKYLKKPESFLALAGFLYRRHEWRPLQAEQLQVLIEKSAELVLHKKSLTDVKEFDKKLQTRGIIEQTTSTVLKLFARKNYDGVKINLGLEAEQNYYEVAKIIKEAMREEILKRDPILMDIIAKQETPDQSIFENFDGWPIRLKKALAEQDGIQISPRHTTVDIAQRTEEFSRLSLTARALIISRDDETFYRACEQAGFSQQQPIRFRDKLLPRLEK